MKKFSQNLLRHLFLVFAIVELFTASAQAAIIVDGYYRMGEIDPGATIGNASNATALDSSGNGNTLTAGTLGTYSAGNVLADGTLGAVSSNISITSAGYTRAAFGGLTDNFGIEAFLKIPAAIENSVPVYNGHAGNSGFGFYTGPATGNAYAGIYGGITFLNTGIAETAGDNVYLALVKASGLSTMYVKVNGGPIQTINFGAVGGPNATNVVDPFLTGFTGGFSGGVDEARIFHFNAGEFVRDDLLIPEPTSALLLVVGAVGLLARRRRRK